MDFDELYQNYWQKVFRLCMGYVNDYATAQDLAQETFISAWKHFGGFRNEAHIGTWIYRVATNHCLRSLERKRRVHTTDLPLNLYEERQPDTEPHMRLLYRFISELPEIDRIVISLELEEVKQSEIAQITGLSESNIRVKIHRIKERLTQKFNEHGT